MLPEAHTDAPRVYEGVRFNVHRVMLPGRDNAPVPRDVVVHPGAAMILPLLDDDHIVTIRNERFAVGDALWELPCGTLEAGEPPIKCAARELVEEAGYRSENIDPLMDFWTCPGICTEHMFAFIARDLQHVGQSLDESERITAEVVPLQQAIDMVSDGRIRDAKTIAALLYYHAFSRSAT